MLLRRGSRGFEVEALQNFLNIVAGPASIKLVTDGAFGNKTDIRVRDFQRKNVLKVDGIVGPQTMGQMEKMTGSVMPKFGGAGTPKVDTPAAASSGPGKVRRTNIEDEGNIVLDLRLYNFDVNSSALKIQHLEVLKAMCRGLSKSRFNHHFYLVGAASSTGSDTDNQKLSQDRADAVAGVLKSQGIPVSRIQPNAIGELRAIQAPPENDWDRRVSVTVLKTNAKVIEPIKRQIPPPKPTPKMDLVYEFDIQFDGEVSGGEIVDIRSSTLAIRNPWTKKERAYQIFAAGAGLSILPIGGSLKGPWTRFKVDKAMTINDFEGTIAVTSGGGLNNSFMKIIHLHAYDDGTWQDFFRAPLVINVTTGVTLNIGVDLTYGVMG